MKIKSTKKVKRPHWELDRGDTDKFYGTILQREHLFTGQHKLYVTAYSKNNKKVIHINKTGPTVEAGKYYNQRLTITTAHHWNSLVQAIDSMRHVVGWSKNRGATQFAEFMGALTKTHKKDKDKQIAAKRLRRNKKLKDEIEQYKNKLSEFMEMYRIANLPQFNASLAEFKSLVDQNLTENKYQQFLADPQNTWILGLEYISVNRHSRAGTEGFPDFVPERFDGFYDVIEFKRPNHPVLEFKDSHWRQSSRLKDGISQLMDYLELYDRNPKGTDDILENDIKYRPNGILIIGNLRNNSKKKEICYALRKHNSFLQRIQIITYDQLADRADTALKLISEKDKTTKKRQ